MQVSQTFFSFINEHAEDDLSRLLFSANRYPDIDVPFAVEQIRARRSIREKLPAWYACDRLLFPSKLATEQCSSEQTARYKQRLLNGEFDLCDLTGGLGVDTYYFAQKVEQVIYVEHQKACFDVAMHNFAVLNATTIKGYNEEAEQLLNEICSTDVFYIDPARRGKGDSRVFALSDCEPDLVELLPVLLSKAPRVIAKLSPMLDIQHTLGLLPQTEEIHVVSVKNECKELLFVLSRDRKIQDAKIHCVNFTTNGTEQHFRFTLSEERAADSVICESVQTYLYEPNASVLKAGAYKQTALQLGLGKLHINSHLYTSESLISSFPGRVFQVEEVLPFNGKLCKKINQVIPQANLSIRNFPLSVNDLRKRVCIADGGDTYLFATTLAGGEKVFIRCSKIVS